MSELLAQVPVPDYPTVDNQGNPVTGFLSGNINALTVGEIIGEFLPYVYVFAGLGLLLMLLWGGILLMTAGEDQAKVKEGYGKITAGFIGFAIIFVSYFVVQIVEIMLGVKIL